MDKGEVSSLGLKLAGLAWQTLTWSTSISLELKKGYIENQLLPIAIFRRRYWS
jgi:hypothetical protein